MPNGRGRPPPPTPPPARVSVPRRESSRGRGEVLKEAGGLRPPASLRSSPRGAARSDTCTAPRCAQRSAGSGGPLRHGRLCQRPGRPVPAESPSRALGIQGEGKGAVSPRRAGAPGPNGVRPKASQSAKDLLIELPERDARSMLKTPTLKEMNRHMWGRSPHPHICLLLFLRWPSSAAC